MGGPDAQLHQTQVWATSESTTRNRHPVGQSRSPLGSELESILSPAEHPGNNQDRRVLLMNTGCARVPGDPAGNLAEAGFSSPAHRQLPRAISPSSGDPPWGRDARREA